MNRNVFDADAIREITRSKRFLAADRAQLDLGEIATWDKHLLREHRLLVPIDVQALYVQPGSAEKMVRLPMLIAGENGKGVANAEDGMPDPFTEGKTRPAGVHLHWAMPDALLRGTLENRTDGAANRLALPVLPDRWVVLRLILPRGASDAVATGWVLEADRAIAVPLGSWTEGGAASLSAKPLGEPLDKEQLTGTVGGAVSWSAVYDAVINRFAFHDPLADLGQLAPNGVDEDCAAYLITGWWSNPAHDPLDKARNSDSLHELLERLRWRQMYEWGDEQWAVQQEKAQFDLRKALGLTTAERWSSPRPINVSNEPRAQAINVAAHVPIDKTFMEQQTLKATSAFSIEAEKRFVAPPWHLRSSLLHGAIYGVPVTGTSFIDRRPQAKALSVAFGQHDDDLLAAFAATPQATADQQRTTERLLAAFTAQKVNALASANGLVELEEHEHAAAFSSLPSESAGTDRYLQRVQTGGVGGLNLGKQRVKAASTGAAIKVASDTATPRHARPSELDGVQAAARVTVAGEMFFAGGRKPTLVKATTMMVNDAARSRVGEVLTPTEARVVNRPAARFTFPDEPMVAIRGVARSLRHGNDGRGSEDGKLTCRWPPHVISEISGVIAKDRFIRSLGNGSVPPEVLALAREVLLHDPYHDEWIARAVAPAGAGRTAIFNRLKAESVLRFGHDGIYDGATVAFHPTLAKTPRARRA
ncbi:MAG: hypothetical protein M3X11_23120, partial [Acidobacteriota bacterium]|nr:hypothetical protein [Acidobacteriota bacterium]